jgi:two-component system phosphate regulon response regulator OmpR
VAARGAFERQVPDLAILDIRMPGEDGLSLARWVRDRHKGVGIIMLTTAADVVDRVVGLEMGADDYVPKPFDLRELLARVKSVLRRRDEAAKPSGTSGRARFGVCEFDLGMHKLFNADGKELPLTAMEFDLLRVFIENPDRALNRDQIMELARHRDWDVYDRSIDLRIMRLRRKVERNPGREAYWTAPYMDAGGTGAMVSHGKPVYVDDEFIGIVGTDVRLRTLEHFLQGLPFDVGRLMVLDDQRMLLADSAGSPENAIVNAPAVLPGVLTADKLGQAVRDMDEPLDTNGYVLAARRIEQAPWTLAYLVSDDEINSLLLPRLLPYAVILVALAATVFGALYLLRREFIRPSLALVRYIRDASLDSSVPRPGLPRLWQTWVGVVSRALNDSRDATRRLRESEGRLQQILNNSSAVVYVRDRDDRFILVNKPFERLLGVSQDEVVGKNLDEVFPQQTAAEFRANDRRVIEANAVVEFEEHVALKDGVRTYISSKFPLFDADGEIYAICGISKDITSRKKSEEILRQSALGISEVQGKDVFNSLIMHLSRAIGTDLALIGVLEKGDMIRPRALYAHGRIEDNITYQLAGSPCENVVGQQFRSSVRFGGRRTRPAGCAGRSTVAQRGSGGVDPADIRRSRGQRTGTRACRQRIKGVGGKLSCHLRGIGGRHTCP